MPLSCDDAVSLLRREVSHRGLAETHRVAALHSAPDLTAEGAAYAAIVISRDLPPCPRGGRCTGLKFLITQEGVVSCQAWCGRGPRAHLPHP